MHKLIICLFFAIFASIMNSCKEASVEQNPLISPHQASLVSSKKEDVKKIQEANSISIPQPNSSSSQATNTDTATKSQTSTTITIQPPTLPGVFSIRNISPGLNTVNLSWENSVNATNYTLRRGTVFGAYQTINTAITSTFYQDKDLTPNTVYYYTISATNKYGISDANYAFSTKTLSLVPGIFTALATPIHCTVSISWTNSIGATSYQVSRRTSNLGPVTTLSSAAASPFIDNGLIGGALIQGLNYYYSISAVNSAGNTTTSQVITSINPGTLCEVPARSVPGSFTMQNVLFSEQKAQITWTPSAGAKSYIIRRGSSQGAYPTLISSIATSPYIDTGLDNNTNYFYMVTATSTTNAMTDAYFQQINDGTNINTLKTPACFLKSGPTGSVLGTFPNNNQTYSLKITQSQCEQQAQSCSKTANGTCTAWLFH